LTSLTTASARAKKRKTPKSLVNGCRIISERREDDVRGARHIVYAIQPTLLCRNGTVNCRVAQSPDLSLLNNADGGEVI
jgi:hypothetical protein